ncbi:MAG: hypoxanthine phosphoribosyltransferase [Clostridiales bacterium]|jgi:hypoxanthine phosphoribosyltransferase|nr:hypoxanthine phosphoribosyltransferase [Clostridiales bacterium]MDR2712812.1 hypoxanthine phosphoribosyltransferase [Clostridiales bacterium]
MDDSLALLISDNELKQKVEEMGRKINHFYAGQDVDELVIIGILRGSFIFMADLVRQLSLPLELDFMDVSSYGKSSVTTGMVRILKDISEDITNKHVLLVEDIVDSGLTLKYLSKILWSRSPRSLRICTLLNKPSRRQVELEPDFCGFLVPDEFIVGYGLDFAGKYRELPYLAILKQKEQP